MVRRLQPKKIPGNTSDRVDRDMLHQLLWDTRDRYNYSTFKSGELAEKLGLTPWHMSRIIGELIKSGKLTRMGSKYRVNDPTITKWVG